MIDTQIRIERLDANRLADLERLHKAVYGKRPAPGYFTRKYDTSFAGLSFIGYLAYDERNFPVAYYGVLPLFMEQGGKVFLAAQSGDTMTDPAYRKKGLFVLLANHTYELCRQQGIKLVYGFPNQNSWHGLASKLGWKMEGRLLRYSIGVNQFVLTKLSRRFNLFTNHRRRILRNYLLPENGIEHSAALEGYGGVHRSEAYLRYKKYGNSFVLKIAGARLWARIRESLDIGDMHCDGENFDNVMQHVRTIASKTGVNTVNFQVSPGTKLNALFASRYTPMESFAIGFKVIDESISTHDFKFTFADIDIF